MTRLRFDHAYVKDLGDDIHELLLKRGFLEYGNAVEHPGSLYCQFFAFRTEPVLPHGRPAQYIEFCSVRDLSLLRQRHLDEKKREPAPHELLQPGYSVISEGSLDEFFQTHLEEFKSWEPALKHKNYKWKEDSVSRLPGWNFITFNRDAIPLFYSWITEYEPSPNRVQNLFIPESHPNSCDRILGIVLRDDEGSSQEKLVPLVSRLDDAIYWADPRDTEWHAYLEKVSNKPSPFGAVVLSCQDIEVFKSIASPDYEVDLPLPLGKAYGLRLPDYAWDILVVPSTR